MVALALAALAPSPAFADSAIEPPIAYLSPALFQSIPVSHGGFEVTYTCPSYPGGDASDYGVRFSNGDTRGEDGRLIASGPYWMGEAAVLPGPQPGTCRSQLLLPRTPYPPEVVPLGTVVWQVYRRCGACWSGWEVAPVSWVVLRANIEGAELILPDRIYAGYLTRLAFRSEVDLSGTEVAVQGVGRWAGRGDWSDLARAPWQPGENVFFVKLPVGSHKLRLDFDYGSFGMNEGLPYEEVEVLRPRGKRATSARDDGLYFAGKDQGPLFEVSGGGKLIRDLRIAVPLSCAAAPPLGSAEAQLPSARIAPDGSVTAQGLSGGAQPTYTTLVGKLVHRRFRGTITASVGSCQGSVLATARRRGPAP